MTRDEIPKVVSEALGFEVRWADQSQLLCDARLILEAFDVPLLRHFEAVGKLMDLEELRPEVITAAGGCLTLIFRKTQKSVKS